MKQVRVDKCLELDHRERECQIILYTHKEEYNFLTHLFMGRGIHRHKWYLVAQFQRDNQSDAATFTFEAQIGQDGRIDAYRAKDASPDDPVEKILIGTVRTSPKELLNMAQKHPYNGTSAPILAGKLKCQDWLNHFAHMISPQLRLP